jgi:hypothetical protein
MFYVDQAGNGDTDDILYIDGLMLVEGSIPFAYTEHKQDHLYALELPDGNAGIKFPASQSASADANTLDDYEEGTWTPVLGGATSESGQTYASQIGTYVKVGKKVTINGYVRVSTIGTITGDVIIKGLPFECDHQTTMSYAYAEKWTLTASHILTGRSYDGISYILLEEVDFNGGAPAKISSGSLENYTSLYFSMTYLTD